MADTASAGAVNRGLLGLAAGGKGRDRFPVLTYYGKAWLDECVRRLNHSKRHLAVGKRLSGRFCFRLYDGPDGKDREAIWEFERGTCKQVEFKARRAPWRELRDAGFDSDWIGRFSCSFDMMKKVNKREISPARALASFASKVEGKKFLMAWLLPAINSWNQVNASVPCAYEFCSTDDDGNALPLSVPPRGVVQPSTPTTR